MNITKRDKRTKLDKEIDDVIETLSKFEKNTDEYSDIVDNLGKLYSAKNNYKPRSVSPDTIAVVAGNLLGIVLILEYEKINIVTTKAIGFVMKGRV